MKVSFLFCATFIQSVVLGSVLPSSDSSFHETRLIKRAHHGGGGRGGNGGQPRVVAFESLPPAEQARLQQQAMQMMGVNPMQQQQLAMMQRQQMMARAAPSAPPSPPMDAPHQRAVSQLAELATTARSTGGHPDVPHITSGLMAIVELASDDPKTAKAVSNILSELKAATNDPDSDSVKKPDSKSDTSSKNSTSTTPSKNSSSSTPPKKSSSGDPWWNELRPLNVSGRLSHPLPAPDIPLIAMPPRGTLIPVKNGPVPPSMNPKSNAPPMSKKGAPSGPPAATTTKPGPTTTASKTASAIASATAKVTAAATLNATSITNALKKGAKMNSTGTHDHSNGKNVSATTKDKKKGDPEFSFAMNPNEINPFDDSAGNGTSTNGTHKDKGSHKSHDHNGKNDTSHGEKHGKKDKKGKHDGKHDDKHDDSHGKNKNSSGHGSVSAAFGVQSGSIFSLLLTCFVASMVGGFVNVV